MKKNIDKSVMPKKGEFIPEYYIDGKPLKRKNRKEIIYVSLAVLLFASILFFSVYRIATDSKKTSRGEELESYLINEAENNPDMKDTYEVTLSEDDIFRGPLILVNSSHVCRDWDKTSLKNIFSEKNSLYSAAFKNLQLKEDAIAALNSLTEELCTENDDSFLMINGAYRSYVDQKVLYKKAAEKYGEEEAKNMVSPPGYSEHNTGLCFDLTAIDSSGNNIRISDYTKLKEFEELLPKYGFVKRYPEGKSSVTGIESEPYHYRYVGKPHSYIMNTLGLCLEEYIDLIKKYDGETKLFLLSDGTVITDSKEKKTDSGYGLYYVRYENNASIDIPKNTSGCELFGDNEGGFIVVLKYGSPEM